MTINNVKTHAVLDFHSRSFKAKKIELLVNQFSHLEFGEFLEVGCGSGYIAQYFSELGFGEENTYAVDIADERQVRDGFKFLKVTGTTLPFQNNQFNLIVSNQVIEHVGNHDSQMNHLAELHRILKPGGVLYFAGPNKWRLIEPHYNLPLLSWFNHRIASTYMRLSRKGKDYDCNPLSLESYEHLLNKNNFNFKNVTIDAIQTYALIEGGVILNILSRFSHQVFNIFLPIIPTFIFICEKK